MGDSNEKLAEGIKMLAVSIPPSAKRTVLSDLITVSSLGCVLGLNCTSFEWFVRSANRRLVLSGWVVYGQTSRTSVCE